MAPIGHGLKLFGLDQMSKRSGLPYYLLEGLLLLVGAYFYNVNILPRDEHSFGHGQCPGAI